MTSDSSGLGSLAQSARSKQLNVARGILLVIGVLTIGLNAFFFTMIESQVDEALNKEVRAAQSRGLVVDQAALQELRQSAIRIAQLIQGVGIALGVVFVICGLLVKSYPVPVTITSLVLYVGAAIVFGAMDPSTLLQGIIIKIVIVVLLVKSVQAAIAYQREEEARQFQEGRPREGQEPFGVEST